jgi:hypothetical protein
MRKEPAGFGTNDGVGRRRIDAGAAAPSADAGALAAVVDELGRGGAQHEWVAGTS